MANKIAKLTMLTMLFSTALGFGLTSGISNTLSTPTKTAVSYVSSDDLNDHDTNHSSDDGWIPLEEDDFGSNGDYASGTLTGGSSESETKYYYLNDNVTLSTNDITIRDYVTFCLNGKTLTGTSNSAVVFVDGAYFNLCDCSGDDSGKITGANTVDNDGDGGISVVSASTFNMYGGTISGNIAGYGGGVKLDDSVFNMYGGTISNNEAENGGGVFATRSTFNMYEGAISNNKASNCGGVYLNSSTFNMYGGTITKNTDEWRCGGVYLIVDSSSNDISSTFNMYNGTISENESSNYTDGVRITSNCSFYMYGGYLGDDFLQNDDGSISITGGYLSTTAYNSIKDNDYIPTGYIAKEIEDDTWKYIVVATSHADTIDGRTIEFDTYLDELTYKNYTSITLSGGNYYLATDLNLNVNINGSVYLCLNGKTLEGTGDTSVISVSQNAYFNLCDCSGDDSGTITGGNAEHGGGVFVDYATFNMYGSIISDNTATFYGGGVLLNEATFNMYGGTISGNTSFYEGGGIYIYFGSTFNMYGGIISDNTATYYGGGVGVYSDATFTMYDGTISNNTSTYGRGGGVYVQNDGTFNMYGGYFGNDMYVLYSETISIKGGYFSSSIYESIKDYIDSDYIGVNISTLGTDLDENYLDGYPYAVYATSTTSYSVSDVTDVTFGSTYTPTINTDSNLYTSVAYTYKDGENEIPGLPTDVGEYTVTAHFLYTTTEGYITTNSYSTTEFKVTINQASTSTPSDEEDEEGESGETGDSEGSDDTTDGNSDNSTTNDDTTTSTDQTGLSAGAIAGITIASVFVVGLIAFLVYFFVFKKKKAKSSK